MFPVAAFKDEQITVELLPIMSCPLLEFEALIEIPPVKDKVPVPKMVALSPVVVDKEVINYLMNILPRDFPGIIASVQKINNYAIEHKRKITVPLVKLALNT